LLQSSTGGSNHVYCAPLFSCDDLPGSPRRLEIGFTYPLPESRSCTQRSVVCDARACILLASSFACPWRAPPHLTRTRSAGVTSASGETPLFSIVIAFGVATLVATGLLFLLQISEDFRNA
jgi:hypothetical protein